MKAIQNISVWEDPKQRRSRSVLTCGEKLLHVNSGGELDVKGGEPKTSVGVKWNETGKFVWNRQTQNKIDNGRREATSQVTELSKFYWVESVTRRNRRRGQLQTQTSETELKLRKLHWYCLFLIREFELVSIIVVSVSQSQNGEEQLEIWSNTKPNCRWHVHLSIKL